MNDCAVVEEAALLAIDRLQEILDAIAVTRQIAEDANKELRA